MAGSYKKSRQRARSRDDMLPSARGSLLTRFFNFSGAFAWFGNEVVVATRTLVGTLAV